jgi:ribosomal protein L11 methyltransferase
MAWLSATLQTDCAHAEALADALMERGALSATIEDAAAGTAEEKPQFGEPGSITTPGWDRSTITALFDPAADITAAVAAAALEAQLEEAPTFTTETVEEQNWVQLTQSQFEPIRISDRLWIVPSWHDAPDSAAINLILDPGMAFGTGSHPTTRLCLEWLERMVQPGLTLLDYGCGSGILAIAAAKLGAEPVSGVDIRPAGNRGCRRQRGEQSGKCPFHRFQPGHLRPIRYRRRQHSGQPPASTGACDLRPCSRGRTIGAFRHS